MGTGIQHALGRVNQRGSFIHSLNKILIKHLVSALERRTWQGNDEYQVVCNDDNWVNPEDPTAFLPLIAL